MNIDLPIPNYTRICRRAKSLGQELRNLSHRSVTDLVIDSTGLKVYGEGEWKVRQHGYSKRRTWRKVHLAVCPDLEILGLGGDEEARKLWKKLKGYHRRSLAETAVFRFKQLLGNNLRSRCFANQKAEVHAKSIALNTMTRLGMPHSERIAT